MHAHRMFVLVVSTDGDDPLDPPPKNKIKCQVKLSADGTKVAPLRYHSATEYMNAYNKQIVISKLDDI